MWIGVTVAYAASPKQTKSSKKETCLQKQAEVKKQAQDDMTAFVQETRGQPHEALAGPLPENWQQMVKDAITERLKDPDSAQFKFDKEPTLGTEASPQPADPMSAECKKLNVEIPARYTFSYNWKIEVKVNAKNSFGGYVGYKEYDVRIKTGMVVKVDMSMGEFMKEMNKM